jgi:hypothetical protein
MISAELDMSPSADFDEMQNALDHLAKFQAIASKHGVHDVFQDNGGRIIQIILALNLKVLPGRTGNDAVDCEMNQYELKSICVPGCGGFSTSHHLNLKTIEKLKGVSWIFAFFKGNTMFQIYKVSPNKMEKVYSKWINDLRFKDHLNNPKVSIEFVKTNGVQVWFLNEKYRDTQLTFFDICPHLED